MISYSKIETPSATAHKKLDELIDMIEDSGIDQESRVALQRRFNDAVERSNSLESFKAFRVIGDSDELSRADIADNLELLLAQHELDSKMSRRYLVLENARLVVQMVISLTMIALGFSMIIMPAPQYFEMFTIYYFNAEDGITLMDVISLLIVFTGVYLLISSFIKLRNK